MSKKRRKSRKNKNMIFQGALMVPLNVDDKQDFLQQSRLHGDWAKQSERILSKPRWYRITLYMYDTDGALFHSSTKGDRRLARDEITEVIHVLANDVANEYPDVDLDLSTSFAGLSVPHPEKRK